MRRIWRAWYSGSLRIHQVSTIDAINQNKNLLWYRHDGWRDGSEQWASGAKTVGHRWDVFTTVFAGDSGYHPILH